MSQEKEVSRICAYWHLDEAYVRSELRKPTGIIIAPKEAADDLAHVAWIIAQQNEMQPSEGAQ